MKQYTLGPAEDVPPGKSRIFKIEGREIGVFNVKGKFFALRNKCPHQGAPLCLGALDGTNLPSNPNQYEWGKIGEVLRCPWHGWEFDLETGKSLFNPNIKVKTYQIEIQDDQIVLIIDT